MKENFDTKNRKINKFDAWLQQHLKIRHKAWNQFRIDAVSIVGKAVSDFNNGKDFASFGNS